MVETWNRGIEKIITACKNYGVPEPIFQGETTGLGVEFKNHDAEMRKKLQKTKVLEKTPKKTHMKTKNFKLYDIEQKGQKRADYGENL